MRRTQLLEKATAGLLVDTIVIQAVYNALWKAEQYLGRVHGPNIDSVSPFTSAQLVIHNI